MADGCEFCAILKSKTHLILFKTGEFFGIRDVSLGSARDHLLLCTTQHVESALELSDQTLRSMEEAGLEFLKQTSGNKSLGESEVRLGFHLPPHNSIDHVHLHCFLLPIKSWIEDRGIYGHMLKSVKQIILSRSPKM